VVIGGGVIGLEVASSARDLGCEVTVVEAAERLLGRVAPAEFATEVEAIHRAHGVAIRTASPPAQLLAREGRVDGVALAGGEELPADVVLVGVGVEPRVELAAAAGLAVDNGIVVDEFLRTGEPRIFAAGDVAAVLQPDEDRPVRFEQWRAAEAQGRLAAANMIGAPAAYDEIPWMWSDQYDLHIQAAGHGFGAAEIIRRGTIAEREGLVFFGLDGSRMVAVCGAARGTGVAKAVRLAETLIRQGIPVDVEALADPGEDLRKLLKRSLAAAG
jgi:3-phenylpropionate/trans-cinnamate dioxygenase ferredoxin reductase subunit